MPLISIAMAVYDGEKYLRQQVDSILHQTMQDFELIMCDDCSKDKSWDVMLSLAKEDDRIRIYRNEHNLGFKKNFEKAISFCKGDYIALSDCDDIWTFDHLETLYNNIGNNAIACGNALLVDENGDSLGMTLRYQEAFDWNPQNDTDKLRSILLFRNPYQGSSMLMPRWFVEKAMPIPNEVDYHDVWFAVFACLCGGISYTDKVILKYRRLNTSVTGLRKKRISKIKRFVKTWFAEDRPAIVSGIKQRIGNELNPKQQKVVNDLKMMFDIYSNHRYDIRIYLYELFNYKAIYDCDLTHWI